MEFHRGRNGLLGFGINEVGVVQKVDGLAKSIGLQTNSRLLQVCVQLYMSWADYGVNLASFPGLPRFLFFGLRSI